MKQAFTRGDLSRGAENCPCYLSTEVYFLFSMEMHHLVFVLHYCTNVSEPNTFN